MEEISCEVLILGGGPAAMTATIASMESGADTLLVCKQSPGTSGNIVMARAGHSANFDPSDSAELFLEDTLVGGAYLNQKEVAEAMCTDSADRIRDLYSWGIPFITRPDGRFDLHPQGGHRKDRGIYPIKNWGTEVARPLRKKLDKEGARILENLMAVDLVVDEGCCRGVVCFDTRSGEIVVIRADATILCTGGAGQIYAENTNAGGITGDGFGLALRAGLSLVDMEFVQFYPAVIKRPESNMVVAPTLFPLGARFLNRLGEDIMKDVPGGGDATRDLMARAVYLEIMNGNGVDGAVRMDLSEISLEDLKHFAPDNLRLFERRNVSPHSNEIYVTPKAHFFMGGVPIDGHGATELTGLFAAGEVTAGAHGANRLSNNAFTEAHTLGWRAGKSAAECSQQTSSKSTGVPQKKVDERVSLLQSRSSKNQRALNYVRDIQKICWEGAGIVRDAEKLENSRLRLHDIHQQLSECGGDRPGDVHEAIEAENICLTARAVVEAALIRTESRGAHYRADHPGMDDENWRVNVSLRLISDHSLETRTKPVQYSINESGVLRKNRSPINRW